MTKRPGDLRAAAVYAAEVLRDSLAQYSYKNEVAMHHALVRLGEAMGWTNTHPPQGSADAVQARDIGWLLRDQRYLYLSSLTETAEMPLRDEDHQ
jgi:hypothetical protein